jgi:Inner membrane component of T3SS, cytoplasmic domain
MPLALAASSGQIVKYSLLVVLWGLSVAAAYWDLKRQFLPRAEMLAWLAVVALLPGLGLAAYLLFRLFSRAFPLASTGALSGTAKRRVTQLRQAPAGAPGRTGTILAADLVQETVADRRLVASLGLMLAVVAGPHTGQEFSLALLPARLGRGPEAALRLDRDLGVSRQHAEIYRQDGIVRIRDLGSSHGLSVNGVVVHDKAIEPGDKIELGLSALVVKEDGA